MKGLCSEQQQLTPVLKHFSPQHSGVEIELYCEQSTAFIPRIERGDLDLALISSDRARQGSLLFHEPLVWVGAPQFEIKIHLRHKLERFEMI